jgi:hypothetical protein
MVGQGAPEALLGASLGTLSAVTEEPEELAEEQEEKEAQVLQREPLETELMDHDESGAGEEVDGVEETGTLE